MIIFIRCFDILLISNVCLFVNCFNVFLFVFVLPTKPCVHEMYGGAWFILVSGSGIKCTKSLVQASLARLPQLVSMWQHELSPPSTWNSGRKKFSTGKIPKAYQQLSKKMRVGKSNKSCDVIEMCSLN